METNIGMEKEEANEKEKERKIKSSNSSKLATWDDAWAPWMSSLKGARMGVNRRIGTARVVVLEERNPVLAGNNTHRSGYESLNPKFGL